MDPENSLAGTEGYRHRMEDLRTLITTLRFEKEDMVWIRRKPKKPIRDHFSPVERRKGALVFANLTGPFQIGKTAESFAIMEGLEGVLDFQCYLTTDRKGRSFDDPRNREVIDAATFDALLEADDFMVAWHRKGRGRYGVRISTIQKCLEAVDGERYKACLMSINALAFAMLSRYFFPPFIPCIVITATEADHRAMEEMRGGGDNREIGPLGVAEPGRLSGVVWLQNRLYHKIDGYEIATLPEEERLRLVVKQLTKDLDAPLTEMERTNFRGHAQPNCTRRKLLESVLFRHTHLLGGQRSRRDRARHEDRAFEDGERTWGMYDDTQSSDEEACLTPQRS